MDKLTIERLEKFVNDIKNDGMCDITDHQVESALIQLLAYEQAAKNPVAFVDERGGAAGGICWAKSGKRELPHGTELYAAPVLPKQPRWPAAEVERDALRYRFLRDKDFFGDEDEPGLVGWEGLVELGYNEFDAAVDARISHPDIDYVKLDTALRKHIPAQPVSEPYKLKDAVEDIRNSGVEIDADKIKAERDALNSPVIPDGWKLVPVEPTAAMFHAFNDCDYGRKSMRERYIQMIEAAPAQESE
ncbi:MAG: hypothetical protein ACTID4_14990 [Hafnia alvei]|uniref:hypothetical protein n=1 Tax=Hafnia alvei TaxID=569 RepID=UPI003F92F204